MKGGKKEVGGCVVCVCKLMRASLQAQGVRFPWGWRYR